MKAALGKIAMAPVWLIIGIAALPFILLGVIGRALDKVSPDGSPPKRGENEKLSAFLGKWATWAALTGLLLFLILGAAFQSE